MTTLTAKDDRHWLNKVPEVTLIFWLIKMLSTTVGETAADFLNVNLNFGLSGTSIVMGGLLVAALVGQMRATRYIPWIYWLTVVLVSIFGTLVTDNLTDNLNVPLPVSAAIFSGGLLCVFALWYGSERTLSISSIRTPRREMFYWSAILLTFALGTAAGDLMSEGLQLGFAVSTALFAGLIGAVAAAHYLFGMNRVLAFWMVYILTRPLGASVGDLLSQPVADGGLGFGTPIINELFFATIVVLIGYLSLLQRRVSRVSA